MRFEQLHSIRGSMGSRSLIILIDLQSQHPTAWMGMPCIGTSLSLCFHEPHTNDGIPAARTDHIHAGLRSEHPEYLFDSRLFSARSHWSEEAESELERQRFQDI
jgi:hypothetical protein